MKHPAEEELISYHDGETSRRESIAAHVADCPECRAELKRIDEVLSAVSTMAVPHPGDDYGRRVWRRIESRLGEKADHWWRSFLLAGTDAKWFAPRRRAAAGSIAALVLAAFLVGRMTKRGEIPLVVDAGKVRERVLIMAAGEHLGRSEMVLVELANVEPQGIAQKRVNISSEQKRAEDLLEENRLYRQTALEQGDTALAGVLDELERVLVDVARSPQDMTARQFEEIQQRIEARGILFKVRVVGKELRQRQESGKASHLQNKATNSERNKT